MTKQEARACVENIKASDRNTRALLLDLYERHGWEALEYDSWRACVVGEFKQSERYLYKQLEAAQVEKAICPIGQNSIGAIKESHLRPLTSLPPAEQREVYQRAVETAPEGKVTAKHIEETIKEVKKSKGPEKQEGECRYTETYPVTDALIFAGFAISQLERIRDDDPKREDAFVKIETWIKNKRR